MKIKQLKKIINDLDDEIEVITHDRALGTYFSTRVQLQTYIKSETKEEKKVLVISCI